MVHVLIHTKLHVIKSNFIMQLMLIKTNKINILFICTNNINHINILKILLIKLHKYQYILQIN